MRARVNRATAAGEARARRKERVLLAICPLARVAILHDTMTADELASLSEKAARLIASGSGLRALAQMLADELHGAVLIEDDQWRHLALAEPRPGVGPLPPSFAPFYREAKSSNGVAVRVAISDALHATCVQMPGASDGEFGPGYVTLFLRNKQRPDSTPALRILASAAAVEYARRGTGRGASRLAFWEHFLGGSFADVAELRAQAHAIGIPLAPSYLVGVFDLDGAPSQNCRDLVAQALAPAEASCPLGGAGTAVIALFPVRHQVDVARARQAAANAVRDLQAQGAAASVNCGLGAYHGDLIEVPLSLREAREALALGRRLFGRGHLAVYPDLGIYALLHAGAERAEFLAFAQAQLEPLAAYDRKHKTDLLATLQLYFDVGENVKEAAERLSVHRHTIFYRL
ncbi:MAG TPA: helix-turn-helix domain-containing protein, partial [Candidatus Acidoferrales bacterium]|nr:helix-turn-helix domain-containing protein [Candidatus Acidoferrales bacterium]